MYIPMQRVSAPWTFVRFGMTDVPDQPLSQIVFYSRVVCIRSPRSPAANSLKAREDVAYDMTTVCIVLTYYHPKINLVNIEFNDDVLIRTLNDAHS